MFKHWSFRLVVPFLMLLALVFGQLPGSAAAHSALDKEAPKSTNTVIIVNDTGDGGDFLPGDNVCETADGNGVCTLRAAIDEANSTPALDIILFSIPGSPPYTINTTGYDVKQKTNILAYGTATGSGPGIWIVGPGTDNSANIGFNFETNASGSQIDGVRVSNFFFGIMDHADQMIIGSDLDGSHDLAERSVFGGNQYGVYLASSNANAVNLTTIANNWFGTFDGSSAMPNINAAILLEHASRTKIALNLISGNTNGYGVYLATGSYFSWVYGNRIGSNLAGTAALANKNGVYVHDSQTLDQSPDLNIIGLDVTKPVSAQTQRNIISGNSAYNVRVEGPGAIGDVVRANWIGPLNLTTSYLASPIDVSVQDHANKTLVLDNIIGGTGLSNPGVAIDIAGGANNTKIQSNLIGLMPDALHAAPNQYGIRLGFGAYRTIIGTDGDGNNDALEGNYISGNNLGNLSPNGFGIYASTVTNAQNVIAGNHIGLDGNLQPLGNKWGVYFDTDSHDNRVGSDMNGTNDGDEANIITGNLLGGVAVVGAQTGRNQVTGNHIYGNNGLGIDLEADGNTNNDGGDSDAGANNHQNFAQISGATYAAGQLTVRFKVDTTTGNAVYPLHVDFYKADNNGQGVSWLGRVGYSAGQAQTVVTSSFNPANPPTLAVGESIVAVVSDNLGNSSEFSRLPFTITAPATATPTRTATATKTATKTATATRTATGQPSATRTVTSTPTKTQTPGGPTNTPTVTVTPCALSFSDVHSNDYFYTPVLYLACQGTISGYADGTFRPFNVTTRSQLAKIIVGAEGWPIDTTGAPHFNDVAANNPFYNAIETAFNRGVISGYGDGSFKPFTNVTRGQLSKIVVKAEGWALLNPATPTFDDVATNNPFYQEIETAAAKGIISGYDLPNGHKEFRWGNNATRGQIAKIVYLAVTAPALDSAAPKK